MVKPARGLATALATFFAASAFAAVDPAPISYKWSVADAATHIGHVEAIFPAGDADKLDLMMPVWSPGYYRREDYAAKVRNIVAKTPDGKLLKIQRKENHWTAETAGGGSVVVTYDLLADGRSVTTSYLSADMAVINGGSTFITLAEKQPGVHREHHIDIELLPAWKNSASGLDPSPDGNPNHYVASDFDRVADAPIVAGNLRLTEFKVGGIPHLIADAGNMGTWDSQAEAANLQKFVRANANFWAPVGGLPYKRYVFLNIFRQGAGGLEHMNSCLLTTNSSNAPSGGAKDWLNYVSHEYFHCYNVKRFRPIELGPFDYETPPLTPSLWISEGLTTYYGELFVTRGGITTPAEWLTTMSGHIRALQNTPGRLVQTLEQASLTVFTGGSTSGVGADGRKTVSYYGKGTVMGFVLDARIRHLSNGQKSLDDVMREGLKRYGYPRPGFKPGDFVALCSEIAGVDMKDWFHSALSTTDELDYTEALDWYGLHFTTPPATAPTTATTRAVGSTAFTMVRLPDATPSQKAHLAAVTAPD
jgi:predicted metalloprotease with PDZ domain